MNKTAKVSVFELQTKNIDKKMHRKQTYVHSHLHFFFNY
ncbi:MAG: hypothetical protein EZS26_000067 [Candidatus Ordinivivax streblomastigis]|jgi:hypothetical protein|uniref:Uncharacterized protein n=1 Tax=Candidatus Ordinivivax streblomastigis TaxID=2540710 RepID=A0A5M8P5I2_9BACT|nr:MAG: hypothetical protein EZS26_000067 [Candidatus Ordinivivax streblomastigis]